jgi:hypothetical protein
MPMVYNEYLRRECIFILSLLWLYMVGVGLHKSSRVLWQVGNH